MFWVRLRSGIILLAIMITAMILGGYVLLGLTFAVSLIGMFELYKVYSMEKTGAAIISYLTAVAIYVFILFYIVPNFRGFTLAFFDRYGNFTWENLPETLPRHAPRGRVS